MKASMHKFLESICIALVTVSVTLFAGLWLAYLCEFASYYGISPLETIPTVAILTVVTLIHGIRK